MADSSVNAPKLLVIVGPTAVGKTALSLHLAKTFQGEVISADSRQIYRYMDIGTAKATAEERAQVSHHLIDIVDPDQELSLAQYLRRAKETIEKVGGRGRLPILVGGTGLYVKALLEGWTVPQVSPNRALRKRLREEANQRGHEWLHQTLADVDPMAAQRIDARNVRRVIRALEVYHQTGMPISRLQAKQPPNYHTLTIGLTMPREVLYERIDTRIARMIKQGLEDEVRRLISRGYGYDLPSMSGLGYRQIGCYLRGEIPLDEAIALIKRHTRRYVRQQYNWFRLADPTIHWFDAAQLDESSLDQLVRAFLRSDQPSEAGKSA